MESGTSVLPLKRVIHLKTQSHLPNNEQKAYTAGSKDANCLTTSLDE